MKSCEVDDLEDCDCRDLAMPRSYEQSMGMWPTTRLGLCHRCRNQGRGKETFSIVIHLVGVRRFSRDLTEPHEIILFHAQNHSQSVCMTIESVVK
jgi:hypothetical protein